jgi:SAM-dependent methyltransferase
MATIGERDLSALLLDGTGCRLIEPRIYSVLPERDPANDYDTRFGALYDLVACNPLYNRIIWGYPVNIFTALAHEALSSSARGAVLDLGCGSLAFTAETYSRYSERPVVLVDQSLNMLRRAKSRLVKANGNVPDNMIFLHADALRLPFREKSFQTVISENLLHCLADTGILLRGLQNILAENGRMYFTTLIRNHRLADRYLEMLARSGKLVSRTVADHQAVFAQLGIPVQYDINGNMLSIFSEEA